MANEEEELLWVLEDVVPRLGTMELRVLVKLAERIYMGQREYGELTPTKRNWPKEALEEMLDGMVYTSCLLEEIGNER